MNFQTNLQQISLGQIELTCSDTQSRTIQFIDFCGASPYAICQRDEKTSDYIIFEQQMPSSEALKQLQSNSTAVQANKTIQKIGNNKLTIFNLDLERQSIDKANCVLQYTECLILENVQNVYLAQNNSICHAILLVQSNGLCTAISDEILQFTIDETINTFAVQMGNLSVPNAYCRTITKDYLLHYKIRGTKFTGTQDIQQSKPYEYYDYLIRQAQKNLDQSSAQIIFQNYSSLQGQILHSKRLVCRA